MASRTTKRQRAALDRLHRQRREAEGRLFDLRRAIDRELGAWAPKGVVWAVPLVAFACGVALALATRRRPSSDDE